MTLVSLFGGTRMEYTWKGDDRIDYKELES